MLPCAYKQLFGIDCPACGAQRSFIELLKGNFNESFHLYPALLPTIILIIAFILHLSFRLPNGRKTVLWLARIDLVIITISYLYKLIFL